MNHFNRVIITLLLSVVTMASHTMASNTVQTKSGDSFLQVIDDFLGVVSNPDWAHYNSNFMVVEVGGAEYEIPFNESATSTQCADGFSETGGECTKTITFTAPQTNDPKVTCSSGFVQMDGQCVSLTTNLNAAEEVLNNATTSGGVDYQYSSFSCGPNTYKSGNLCVELAESSTQAPVPEPTYECPDGSWVLSGDQCSRSTYEYTPVSTQAKYEYMLCPKLVGWAFQGGNRQCGYRKVVGYTESNPSTIMHWFGESTTPNPWECSDEWGIKSQWTFTGNTQACSYNANETCKQWREDRTQCTKVWEYHPSPPAASFTWHTQSTYSPSESYHAVRGSAFGLKTENVNYCPAGWSLESHSNLCRRATTETIAATEINPEQHCKFGWAEKSDGTCEVSFELSAPLIVNQYELSANASSADIALKDALFQASASGGSVKVSIYHSGVKVVDQIFAFEQKDVAVWVNTVNEDDSVTASIVYSVPGVAGNYSATITGNPANGTAVTEGSSITYTPVENFEGADSFKFTVEDGQGFSVEYTAVVDVIPMPDAPTAIHTDPIFVSIGGTSDPVIPVVDDVDQGETFIFNVVTQNSLGTMEIIDNKLVFTSTSGGSGTEVVTIRVTDKDGLTVEGEVSVTVNDPPKGIDIQLRIAENGSGSETVAIVDADVSDTHTVEIISGVKHGALTVNDIDNLQRTFTYTANADYFGVDEFTYRILDNNGGKSPTYSGSVAIYPEPRIYTANGDRLAEKTDDFRAIIGNPSQLSLLDHAMTGVFGGVEYPLPMHLAKVVNEPSTGIPVYWELHGKYTLFEDEALKTVVVQGRLTGQSFILKLFSQAAQLFSKELQYVAVGVAGTTERGVIRAPTFTTVPVKIPAIANEIFKRTNGDPVYVLQNAEDVDGNVITGTHDVFLQLESDAPGPVIINGISLNPGETKLIEQDKNFDSNPTVKYDFAGTIDHEGDYKLIFSSSQTASRPVRSIISTWKSNVIETLTKTEPMQLFDVVSATLTQQAVCGMTEDVSTANNNNIVDNPVCYLEWNSIPDGLHRTNISGISNSRLLNGYFNNAGDQAIEYSLSIFNGANKIVIDNGIINVPVASPVNHVILEVPERDRKVKALIVTSDLALEHAANNACYLTTAEDEAIEYASTRYYTDKPTCLVEWSDVPSPLQQVDSEKSPWVSGVFDTVGDKVLGWKISTFNAHGEKIEIGTQSETIVVIEPRPPAISLSSRYSLEAESSVMVMPLGEDKVGNVSIEADNADLIYEFTLNGSLFATEKVFGGWGNSNMKFYKPISIPVDAMVWSKHDLKVKVYYEKEPSLFNELSLNAFVDPKKHIRPISTVIDKPDNTVLNNEKFQVHTKIGIYYSPEDPYDPSTMGEWDVRLSLASGGGSTPITDWQPTTNGEFTFDLDSADYLDDRSLRIVTEARLIAPDVPELNSYERIETSSRALFVVILRGDAIDGNVEVRKLSGAAPFQAVVRLRVDDYKLYRSIESVTWEVSRDGQATWEQYEKTGNDKTTYTETFDTGVYHLRAKTLNTHSGLEAYTPAVEINAYEMATINLEGPPIKFVGSDAVYTAYTTMNEIPGVHGDNVIIEWSTDRGKTWFESSTGDSLTVDGTAEGRSYVWARVRMLGAPEDDLKAFDMAKKAVDFKAVKAPRIYVSGPNVAEKGNDYLFTARVTPPYSGMEDAIDGQFEMPDGSIVNDTEAIFTPNDEDVAAGRRYINFTGWVVGWEAQGAIETYRRRVRVWEYLWPEFNLHYTKTAGVVPSNINASIRPLRFTGALDTPQYNWVLPNNSEVLNDSIDYARAFTVNSAGLHTIEVTVSDARANSTTKTMELNLGVPEAYEINMTQTYSNAQMREPLGVNFRPYITGGHPKDRIESYTYKVDGEEFSSGSMYARITDLPEGTHNVSLTVQTKFGETLSEGTTIEVQPNNPPTCDISYRETIGSYIVYAHCNDSDGRIKNYEWTLNEDVRTITSDKLSFSKSSDGNYSFTIKLKAIDDSNAYSDEVSLTISQ